MSNVEPPAYGTEPPAYGTAEPQPHPSAAGLRLFEARHQRREAIPVALIGGLGVLVVGAGIVGLSGVTFGLGPFGDGSFGDEPGAVRVVPLVMLLFFATFGAIWAGVVISGLARALGRALIVRIDGDGVTLERRRWFGRERFVPWSDVLGLSAYSSTQRSNDNTSTTHWFQVDLTGGTIERRRLDRRRYSWAALAQAVRTVAPQTPLTMDGALPFRGE